MVNGFYVWSHAFQSSNESAIGQMTAQDFANLWEERGPMDADRRNVATISGMWNIDYYHGNNFFMKQLVNGWTLRRSGLCKAGRRSRSPPALTRTMTAPTQTAPTWFQARAHFLDPHRSRHAVAAEWFNTAAFVANGPGVAGGIGPGGADGNAPRDYLRNPGYRDVDLGLFRDFHFGEGSPSSFAAKRPTPLTW